MPSKLYELRAYKGQREVQTPNRLLVALDLTDPDATNDLLRRHLIAVAVRDGANRSDAHMYHLTVHETRDGRPERSALATFALPVEV